MKRGKWWTYGIFIAVTEGVGALSAFLTMDGMQQIKALPQSALTPPGYVFFIVWTVLYALMGIGAGRVWLTAPSRDRSQGFWLFVFQLIFNFFWSLFYFNMQAFGFSLAWLMGLWLLILLMIRSYFRTDKPAAWMQVPYLLWVAFAGYLNYTMWKLNP